MLKMFMGMVIVGGIGLGAMLNAMGQARAQADAYQTQIEQALIAVAR